MNLFAQYVNERRRRLGKLSLVRWWLSEYLGRGFLGVGLGALAAGLVPEPLRVPIAIGMLFVGGLITLLSYGWKQPSIEVHLGDSNKQ